MCLLVPAVISDKSVLKLSNLKFRFTKVFLEHWWNNCSTLSYVTLMKWISIERHWTSWAESLQISFQTLGSFFTFMWPCTVANFFLIKPTDVLISQIYFVKKLYLFRAVPLPETSRVSWQNKFVKLVRLLVLLKRKKKRSL